MAIDPTTWDVICSAEEFWLDHGCFPDNDRLAKMANVEEYEIPGFLNDPIVIKNLEARGIDQFKTAPDKPKDPTKRARKGEARKLTDIQLAAIATLQNPLDRRSFTEKLSELGVSNQQYNGWKLNPTFQGFLEKVSKRNLASNIPEVREVITRRAAMGDFKFTKLLMEMTGEYVPASQQNASDPRALVLKLVEVIQKHVKDPVILQAIAADFQEITAQGQQNINGSPVRAQIVR